MEQLGNDLSKEKPIIVLAGPDIIDFVSMMDIKAGISVSGDCECDHGSCNGSGSTLKKQD